MNQPIDPRIPIACVTAPLVGILAVVAISYLPLWGSRNEEGFAFTLGVFLLVGSPGAYLLEALIGTPVYRWMQRRNSITVGPVLLAGAVAGSLAYVIPPSLMAFAEAGVQWGELGIPALTGAIGGLAAAGWFWLIYKWPRRGAV